MDLLDNDGGLWHSRDGGGLGFCHTIDLEGFCGATDCFSNW